MNGLNEAGRFFLGLEKDQLQDQMKSLRFKELKWAISEMIDAHDINFHSEKSSCPDCQATHDSEGRAWHGRGCIFTTFANFLLKPSDFGFQE